MTITLSLSGLGFVKIGPRRVVGETTPSLDTFLREDLLRVLITPEVIGGVGLCGLGFLSWLFVLSRYDLGRAIPILTGVGYLVLFFVTRTFLRERLDWRNLAGIVMVVAGVYLLSLKIT